MGYVWNRGTSRRPNYWIRIWQGAHRVQEPARTSSGLKAQTRDQALAILRARERSMVDGETGRQRDGGQTVAQLCDAFEDRYTSSRVRNAEGYKADSKALLAHVRAAMGPKPAAGITGLDVERLRDALLKGGKSAQTVRHVIVRLGRVFAWSIRQRLVKQNPVVGVERPAVPQPWRPIEPERYLTRKEVEALLGYTAKSEPDWYAFVALAVTSGMRLGELLALAWADVDLARGRALVRMSKTGEARTVALHALAVDALKVWRKRPWHDDEDGSGAVFAGPTGTVPNPKTVWVAVRRAIDGAGVRRVRVHDLRHTAATLAVEGGAQLHEVASLLGHRRLETTRRYTHAGDERAAAAVAAIHLRPRRPRKTKG